MNKLFFFLSLVGVLLFHSCFKSDKNGEWDEQAFVISGKVLNADQYLQHKVIEFIFEDVLSSQEQRKFAVTLNDSARFRIEIPVRYLEDFYLNYGRLTTLIAIPGESLEIEIDARSWDWSAKGDMVRVTAGSAGSTNRNILRYFGELPSEKYSYDYALTANKEKSPLEYKEYILQRGREYAAFTAKFNKKYKTDKFFRMWVKDHLKYHAWNDLLRYTWEHPLANAEAGAGVEIVDDFEIPEEYFSFLKEYDPNDCSLFSMKHADFLHEYYMYSARTPKSRKQEAVATFQKEGVIAGARILRSMHWESQTGFTRDLFLFRFYLMPLKGKQLAEFEAIYQPADITIPLFSQQIAQAHDALKSYLSFQNQVGTPLQELDDEITKGLIDTLLNSYHGKVVYVDFWAPWCGPCMEEMPDSKALQQYFEGKDVVFLFLANRCKTDAWKATIANEKLGGVHWKITDDQFKIFSSELGISGIPHYTLIDRAGNIVEKSASRPSEKKEITKTIEYLLDKK